MVSSAKDCSVIWQDFDQSFDYYSFVNKNAFGFLNNDVLAFRNESYEAKLWPEIDIKKDDLIKIKNEETKFIQFLPFNDIFEDNKTMKFIDEIDFFLKNYKLNDCCKESLHYNSKLAKTNGKNSVSQVWKTLLYICGVSSPTIKKHGSDNYPILETIENVKNNDFIIEELYNIFIDSIMVRF